MPKRVMRPLRDRRARGLFALALTCAVGLAAGFTAPPAGAIPALPPTWQVVNTDSAFAANGVLLYRLIGGWAGAAEPPLSVDVTAAGGQLVAGALEPLQLATSERYQIFRPASALQPGQSYMAGVMAGASVALTATMPIATTPAPLEVTATLSVTRQVIAQACCMATPTARYSSCVATESEERALISVKPVALIEPANRQFLYRLAITTPEPASESTAWVPAQDFKNGLNAIAEAEADAYCYRLDAYGLIDGVQHTLAEACLDSDLPPLAAVGPTPGEVSNALRLPNCQLPPADFADEWCEANRGLCATQVQNLLCMQSGYASRCSGSVGGGGGRGGAGVGAAGRLGDRPAAGRPAPEPGEAGSGAAGSGEPDERDEPAMFAKSGCAVAAGTRPTGQAWLAFVLLGVTVRGTRGRARRRC